MLNRCSDKKPTKNTERTYVPGSRRDQEEGGELDSQEEASPEEIKRREVVLD